MSFTHNTQIHLGERELMREINYNKNFMNHITLI